MGWVSVGDGEIKAGFQKVGGERAEVESLYPLPGGPTSVGSIHFQPVEVCEEITVAGNRLSPV